MAALTELQNAPMLLAALTQTDPRLSLMSVVAWLDPTSLTGLPDPQYGFVDDDEEPLTRGLHICREYFLPIYVGARQLQLQGVSDRTLENYLLAQINTQLVMPLDSLEELPSGPPINFCGVHPFPDPDEARQPPYDQLLLVFAEFGLLSDREAPEAAQRAAALTASTLAQSLAASDELTYQELGHLLEWMFSCSGNTAVDYTNEDFWDSGFDLPDWSEVEFINELNREAHEFTEGAMHALQNLSQNADMRKALKRNVKAVMKAIDKHERAVSYARASHSDRCFNPDQFVGYARWPDGP